MLMMSVMYVIVLNFSLSPFQQLNGIIKPLALALHEQTLLVLFCRLGEICLLF